MSEEWRPVVGQEGGYEVSSHGRVRSLDRFVHFQQEGLMRKRWFAGRLLKLQPLKTGYLKCCVGSRSEDGQRDRQRGVTVHTLVLSAFVGPRPDGHITRHLDGDGTNNHISNLCYGTYTENIDDSRRHGTLARGEKAGGSRLTAEGVLDIRRRSAAGETHTAIARSLGVDRCTVRDAATGNSWGWLT